MFSKDINDIMKLFKIRYKLNSLFNVGIGWKYIFIFFNLEVNG